MKNALRILFILMVLGGFIFSGNADAVPFNKDAWFGHHIMDGDATYEYYLVIDSPGLKNLKLKNFKFEREGVARDFSTLTGSAGNANVTWFEIDKKRSKYFRKEIKRFRKGSRKGRIELGTNIDEWINNRLTNSNFKLKIGKNKKIIGFKNFENPPPNGGGSPVPEPATMLLLGSGLVGIAAAGRKKLFKK